MRVSWTVDRGDNSLDLTLSSTRWTVFLWANDSKTRVKVLSQQLPALLLPPSASGSILLMWDQRPGLKVPSTLLDMPHEAAEETPAPNSGEGAPVGFTTRVPPLELGRV